MTIGHMVECLSSKVASLTGVEGDATPFNNQKYVDIANQLHERGYQRDGNETLYNPYTGIFLMDFSNVEECGIERISGKVVIT